MAGDWIKLENVTPDKPEVIAMADVLGIDQDAVLGKLVRLWIWADEQTFAGYAECDGVSVTEKFIDRCSCVTGFANAMQRVGWLVVAEGGLAFPNFDRHNGQTAKARGLTAKRMKKMRDARSVTPSVTTPSQKRDQRQRQTKLSSSLVTGNFEKLENEDIRTVANDLKRKLYGDASISDATLDVVWLFGCLVACGVLSEADREDVIRSCCQPGVQNRAKYLRGCLRKRVESKHQDWDALYGAAPRRPVRENGQVSDTQKGNL